MTEREKDQKGKSLEVKIFPVPLPLGGTLGNININTYITSKNSTEKVINEAIKFHLLGMIPEAEKYYKQIINKGCNDHRILSNYATILKDLGKSKEAELSYRKAIKIKPDFADAHYNLGNLLRDLGNLKEAEIFTRKAININPNLAEANYNLGNILRDLGNLKEAEIFTRKAIKINPNFAEAYLNLGNIFKDLSKLKDAELYTRKAIRIKPNLAEANSNLGNILRDLGNLKEAEIFTRKAIKINPNFANAHLILGNILRDLDNLKEAEQNYRKAIDLDGDFSNAYFNLFRHYEQINNLEKLNESLNYFKNLITIKNEILLFRARLNFRNKEYKIASKLINRISPLWVENSNNIQKTIFWSYKAFIEDKLGNYEIAYSSFQKSQEDLLYKRFNKDSYLNLINSYKKNIINTQLSVYKSNYRIEEFNLVFLIGFPRSGTTLLDTILRSHPEIMVIEEKPFISTIEKLITEKFSTSLDKLYTLSKDKIMYLRRQYCELLRPCKNKESRIIIDKLPLHTVSLPLINLLFPNAKVIFAHRHPYDTVLSCFQQSFKPNRAMANLVSLKSSSIMYDRVMNAWDIYKNNLPLNFMTSKYEYLVEEFHYHTLKIIEFLDLEWDENIKNYRKTAINRGKINTPSSSQVVQPLYKSSINKWKNYKKYFEDCHQYLEKWVSYFDY